MEIRYRSVLVGKEVKGRVDKVRFFELRQRVVSAGYGDEIAWQEGLYPCDNAHDFWREYMWVVICSGMKEQVARKIYDRITKAILNGKQLDDVFHHKGKVHAISQMVIHHEERFNEYQNAPDKLSYLQSLPYIGEITKYHLAKNLGLDVVKPDRHLLRIANQYGMSPMQLCKKLADETGYRIATVDLILWRAANLGMI